MSLPLPSEQHGIVIGADYLIRADISFALFREPGRDPVLVIQRDNADTSFKRFADVTGTGFVLAPFAEGHGHPVILVRADKVWRGWSKIAHGLSTSAADEQETLDTATFARPGSEELRARLYAASPDRGYAASLQSFLDDLRQGRFQKLVLSRSQDIPGVFSAGRIFLKACELYPNALVSLMHGAVCGTWIGASPEILIKGSRVTGWSTMALAGTRDVTGDEPWDEKNRREQAIVSNYIRDCLTAFATDLEEDGPKTSRAGIIEHLRTDFHFNLKDGQGPRDCLLALHPTPAVCGLPKEAVRRRILTAESLDRRYYAGFLGWWDNNLACSLYVNLRCLKLSRSVARLYAGGGILPESTLEGEWRETCGKMCTMLALLGD